MHRVVIYSKPDCCLCDQAKAQLEKLRRTHPFEFAEVNILEDPDTYEKFKEQIPVVFIDGKKAFKYRLDEKVFLRRVRSEA